VDDLIAPLSSRLQRFGESRNPSLVLERPTIEEANALWNAARPKRGKSPAITQALVVLAHLYWARYRVLPNGEDQDDLRAALGLFKLIAAAEPELIPRQVQAALAGTPQQPAGDPRRLMDEGVEALKAYERTGWLVMLDLSVIAFRSALAVVSPEDRDYSRILASLSSALQARFRRTGDRVDFDAAIDAGREGRGRRSGCSSRSPLVSGRALQHAWGWWRSWEGCGCGPAQAAVLAAKRARINAGIRLRGLCLGL
jgi:hypothetical protein